MHTPTMGFAGQYSFGTTNISKQLTNPLVYGPNGIYTGVTTYFYYFFGSIKLRENFTISTFFHFIF